MSVPDPSTVLREATRLRKAGDSSAALALLRESLRRDQLDAVGVDKAGRAILRMVTGKEGLGRILLLGQCTTSWLRTALAAVAHGRGFTVDVVEGEYDSVMQELMHRRGESYDAVVLLPWTKRLLGGGERSDGQRIEDELDQWQQAWSLVTDALGSRVVQVGYDLPYDGPEGQYVGGAAGAIALVRRLNHAVRTALPAGAWFVDLERVAGEIGRRAFYDARRYFWTKQPFSESGTVELARHLHAGIRAVTTGPKKVLVLDADNTLWGGVVGEEGPLGIELGDSPSGESFRAFQKYCKTLSKRGVLLTVSTKNNDADAREPFHQNPDMVLGIDDFAAFEANWEPKAMAIERMAQELRLGLDSFVFFDDNPAEREQVRQALPMVEVVEVPSEPADYIGALEAGRYFEALAITEADRKRASQYQTERKRRDAKRDFGDLDSYLESLQMVAEVSPVNDENLQRVVQLIGKTNQFNLTTRRHPREWVVGVRDNARAVDLTVSVRDRFGDHGLVAMVMAVPEGDDTLRIDTFLMSCRVIARGVEDFMFGQVIARARALGFARVVGEYIPSRKNMQVADLYERFGLTRSGEQDGVHRFEALLDSLEPPKTFVQRG